MAGSGIEQSVLGCLLFPFDLIGAATSGVGSIERNKAFVGGISMRFKFIHSCGQTLSLAFATLVCFGQSSICDRAQIDLVDGSRTDSGAQARCFSIGLRLLPAPFRS
ncbi:hypothetical protein BH11PSE12_BH11PSE12_34550 [soil metagenome]